ncbi:protein kinase domain-containing protein [Mucilaginibacter paludis]|uniref:non-specific serine/threonine protein kinase n=1 Tax=Mucilaginibacter paludis DSM 18603 TaxID=714943 RepID=H1YBU9_9SPHI|nr:lanthionine synthetase LanC family protein [Mucilaginibacter paludis]EHQ27027.1 serine/threonine protein kinase [Mucilaginibacter paludis DSM 18603]
MKILDMRPLMPDDPALLDNGTCNYADVLKFHGIEYNTEGYYLVSGSPVNNDKIITVSIIRSQLAEALILLIPVLRAERLPFRLIKNFETAKLVLNGITGFENIGKVLMVYLPSAQNAEHMIQKLVALTSGFTGPAVPGQKYCGGAIYTYHYNFENVAELVFPKEPEQRVFQHKYKVLSNLKPGVKGAVYYGIYVKGLFRVSKCIIKEGKKDMWSDDAGRDMRIRLDWQKRIHDDLTGLVSVPRIIDLFEHEDNAYLVMEFIKGRSLDQVIYDLLNGRSWLQLELKGRYQLIDLLAKVLECVRVLHEKGYVHRDLTPVNFMLNDKGWLYMIDLELAYQTKVCYPLPAFELGTAGFMSPEQQKGEEPTIQEDIYALGGLMVVFLTGLPPVKFDQANPEKLADGLGFLIGSDQMSAIIAACFEPKPDDRPGLAQITEALRAFRSEQPKSSFEFGDLKLEIDNKELIRFAINALTRQEFTMNKGLLKILNAADHRTSNIRQTGSYSAGLASPITGILYVLSLAPDLVDAEVKGFLSEYLDKNREAFLNSGRSDIPGLFSGRAGKALAIDRAMRLAVLEVTPQYQSLIEENIRQTTTILNLADGVAGQLLATLLISKPDQQDEIANRIAVLFQLLRDAQLPDGSWNVGNGPDGKTRVGLGYGVSGIILSLLLHESRYPSAEAKAGITKGLGWLAKNSETKDYSLMNGFNGVALVFTLAFKQYGDQQHLLAAERLLRKNEAFPVYVDNGVAFGLCGLGLVYGLAAGVSDNEQWRLRALWIYTLLVKINLRPERKQISWNMKGVPEHDASLLTGNTGVILFLLQGLAKERNQEIKH